MVFVRIVVCFFVKQKTAYEMRISDWSSDVCSSDLPVQRVEQLNSARPPAEPQLRVPEIALRLIGEQRMIPAILALPDQPCQILLLIKDRLEIGRASCRERVCQYV